jgi:hypothetical protein
MKAVAVAVALIVAASAAQAGGSNYQYDGNRVLVEQRHYHNGNAEAALIGGLIVGTVIAFQNAQQPQVVYQQPQVIVQQPVYQQPQVIYQERQMPVYTDRYAPPTCNPFYDQFGRMAGCMR